MRRLVFPTRLLYMDSAVLGKTELALKYAENCRGERDPIIWIDAKNEDSVLSSYVRCASERSLRSPLDNLLALVCSYGLPHHTGGASMAREPQRETSCVASRYGQC